MCGQGDDPTQHHGETWCPSCRAGTCGAHGTERCYFCRRVLVADRFTLIDFGHRVGLQQVCTRCEERRDNDDERE